MSVSTSEGISLQTSTDPPHQRPSHYPSTTSVPSNSADHPTPPPFIRTLAPSKRASFSAKTLAGVSSKAASSSWSTYYNLKKQSSQWVTEWITDWWGIELISWAISASALLFIFALLESHRGRPLPEWPFLITVNSLVSIFSTISQMAMMKPVVECISQLKWLWFVRKPRHLTDFQSFDDASRGPTGSLVLLGKLHGIHLASLGAAITVVAIAFGPVSQQVVTYPLRLHPVGSASAPQVYLFGDPPSSSNEDLSPPLLAALSNGIDTAGVSQNLSTVLPVCNTGNCTWGAYSSLGICTSTIDISSMLLNNSQSCNTAALNENFANIGGSNPGYPCFNYSLPELAYSRVSQSGSTVKVFGNATIGDGQMMPLIFGNVSLPMLTISTGVYYDDSLVDINILYQPGLQINSTLPPPIALRSSLQFCIQTYNTTVSSSISTTELVSSQILNTTLLNNPPGNTSPANRTFLVNDTTFTISYSTFVNFQNLLLASNSDLCTLLVSPTSTNAQENSENFYCFTSVGESFFEYLQNATVPILGINALMQNVATSLTNSFRAKAGGNAYINEIQGTAFSLISFVEADYIWFTLPLALNLLTLIFLLATMTKSHRLGAKNWKSSNYSTLQGLHPDVIRDGGLGCPSVMEGNAEKLVVKLLDAKTDGRTSGNGWTLVEMN